MIPISAMNGGAQQGMTYYLGIDAGGTASKARLTDAAGRVLGTASGGPANSRIGVPAMHSVFLELGMDAARSAGLGGDAIADIRCAMGVAGINRMGIKARLRELPFPFGHCSFTSDAMIASLGAHHGGDGAILILGTGSIALIKQGEDSYSIGGYGFPISDEGSGAALGLSALRHALRALDGRTVVTPLSQAITRNFDHAIPRIIAWMDEAAPGDYAALAPLVMDYADDGDEIAVSIVNDAALHIERFIDTIVAKGAARVVLMGGLAGRMRPWLRGRVASLLSEPLGDALDGALILAGLPIASLTPRP